MFCALSEFGRLACFLLGHRQMANLVTGSDRGGRAPERRFHHRVRVGAPAWVVVGEQRYAAECVNVSMGGAAVQTEARVTEGQVLRLELSLGLDRGSISIQSEAVRTKDGELGLRFLALDRVSLEAVLSLL